MACFARFGDILNSGLFLCFTVFLNHGGPWEQSVKEFMILVIHVLRDDRKQHFEILEGVQVVCLGSLNKTVEHSAGPGTMVGIDENKV